VTEPLPAAAPDALLDANEYDVVLLDLRMADLGGDTLYDELRDRDPRHASRVVSVTI
jgi:CheY-like chemotaxis protein